MMLSRRVPRPTTRLRARFRLLSSVLASALALASLSAVFVTAGAQPAGAATTAPSLTNAQVDSGDGEAYYDTAPNCSDGYDLWVYDATGTTLQNPGGAISVPLNVGSQTFTYWGDFYPGNPHVYDYADIIELALNGAGSPSLVDYDGPSHNPSYPAENLTTVVNGYTVTLSNFTFTESVAPAKVSPCVPYAGGGGSGPYSGGGSDATDSTGSFTLTVQAPESQSIAFSTEASPLTTVSSTIPAGAGAFGVALTPDGTKALVPNFGAGTVSVISGANTTSPHVTSTLDVGGDPTNVEVSPDGTKAYVITYHGNGFVVINGVNTSNPTVGETLFVNDPGAEPLSPNGNIAYVSDQTGGPTEEVEGLNTSSPSVTDLPFNVASQDLWLSPDGTTLFGAGYGSALQVMTGANTASPSLSSSLTSDLSFTSCVGDLVFSPDGSTGYASIPCSNTVQVISGINTASPHLAETLDVGSGPGVMALSPDGHTLYVADGNSNDMTVINGIGTPTPAVLAYTIPVGASPGGSNMAITASGGALYAIAGGNVVVLTPGSTVGATYSATATASSGLPVSYSIDPASGSGVCSISGTTVSFNAVGTCLIDANQVGNYSSSPYYAAAPQAQLAYTITAPPTISNLPGAPTYGGSFVPTVTAPGNGATSVTTGSPSVCAVSGGTVTFIAAGSCSLTAHVAEGTNNVPEDGSAQTFDVNPAPLSITASSPPPMTYGGSVPSVSASITGFVNGDSASSLTTAPSCSTTALSSSPAGSYVTSCSGAVDPNYTIGYTSGSLTVNPAPLLVTASSASMHYGGAVPAIGATYSGFVNGDSATSPGFTAPTCTAAATSTSPAGSYTSSCSGAVDPNYAITYASGTVTVGTDVITITATSPVMTYGGAAPAVGASYSGFVNGESASTPGFTKPVCTTGAGPTSPVGSTPATSCSGAADANYAFVYVAGTVTIDPAPLTVTASSTQMTYGGTVPFITANVSGLVDNEAPSVLGPGLTCSTTATSSSPVIPGGYPSSCGGASDQNYAITYAGGSVTVVPAPLVVTASSPSVVYGAALPAVVPGYSGFVNGDTSSSLTTGALCVAATNSAGPAVGTYPTSCSGAVDPNYTITYAQGTLTVTPASLSLTASSPTAVYGAAVPPVTAIYSGFVNGDTEASLTTQATCAAAGGPAPVVGSYPTNCSGAADPNYAITAFSGTLTVTPATLSIAASSATITYGSPSPAIAASYSGFVNGDTPASLTTPPTCVAGGGAVPAAGSYTTSCSGAVDPNYSITYVQGALVVGQDQLVVAASSATMTYGGAVPAITVSYSGFVNGDTTASLATGATCGAAGGPAPSVGTYTTSCAGVVDPNYTIRYVTGSLSVTPAPLSITASSPTMTYGGPVPQVGASFSGFVNGDTAASLAAQPVCSAAGGAAPTAGSHTTSCSGAADTNYAISYTSGTLTVNPAPLTITASSPTMSYEAAVPAVTASYGGFVNGDSSGSLTKAPACTTTATTSSPPGTYGTSCSGAVDANYAITYKPGTLTVLLVAACPNEADYGTGQHLAGAFLAGKNLSGDNLAGAILTGANLLGVNLQGANLTGADLQGADLAGVNLQNAVLTGSNLVGANLAGVNLAGVALSCSDLQGANVLGSNLQGTDMAGDNLSGDNFAGANLQSANLTNALVTGTNLIIVNLQSANMTGADLDGAKLLGANLAKIVWSNTICPDGTNSTNDAGTCVNNLS